MVGIVFQEEGTACAKAQGGGSLVNRKDEKLSVARARVEKMRGSLLQDEAGEAGGN